MNGIGRLDWDGWLYGLLAGFIGGGSGALSSGLGTMIGDPTDFNIAHPALLLKVMAWTFLFAGLTPFFAYLHQSPLPPVKTVTTTAVVEDQPGATKMTTVQETKLTPQEEKK